MRRVASLLYLLPAVALGAWAYWPITANFFHGDDFQHLYLIADGRLGEFLVTPHGGHMLVVRNALFALSHALFGVDPRGYFWMVLATHLLNIGLLAAAIAAASGSRRLACAGAALWGISPLNAEALGWYSVYGQVAMTALLLAVLGWLGRVLRDGRSASPLAALGAYLLLVIGSACFGTGIGIAMAAAVALPLCLPGRPNRFARWLFASLAIVVPLLYALVQGLYRLITGGWHASIAGTRDTLPDALTILSLLARLTAVAIARTLTGDWLPGAWRTPAMIGCAALYGLLLALALWRAAPAPRRLLLACLLLAGGAYGIIAAGRGGVASQAVFELSLRYHYCAPALLVLAGCLALSIVGAPLAARPRLATGILLAWLAALAANVALSPPAIDHYDAERKTVAMMKAVVTVRALATPAGETLVLFNRPMPPLNYFARMGEFPGWAGLFVIFFPSNEVLGHPVVYAMVDPAIVAQLRRRGGRRTATLLRTHEEALPLLAAGLPPAPTASPTVAPTPTPTRRAPTRRPTPRHGSRRGAPR
ncbi:hypothetical protein KF840_11825 [bacterium]|nr:hypothetical protein [bacterium]